MKPTRSQIQSLQRPAEYSQSGIALIVGLIFLVILTLLGITAMQTTSLQERMSGNMRDWNVAFQAAEAALLDAQKDIKDRSGITNKSNFATGCNSASATLGLCLPSTTITPIWTSIDWSDSAGTKFYVTYGGKTGATALDGVATQPRYIIEYLNDFVPPGSSMKAPSKPNYAYRITAKGFGASETTRVTLQTTYILQ